MFTLEVRKIVLFVFFIAAMTNIASATDKCFLYTFDSKNISQNWELNYDNFSYIWSNGSFLIGIGNKYSSSASGNWHKAWIISKKKIDLYNFTTFYFNFSFYVIPGNNPEFETSLIGNNTIVTFHIESNMNKWCSSDGYCHTAYFMIKERKSNKTLYKNHYPIGKISHGKWYKVSLIFGKDKSVKFFLDNEKNDTKVIVNDRQLKIKFEVLHDTNHTALWDNVSLCCHDNTKKIKTNCNFSHPLFITNPDWKNILSLSPLQYPVLIAENNSTTLNYLVSVYNPDQIFLLGNITNVKGTKITWQDIPAIFFPNTSAIYVKTFDQALHAAPIASLLHRPIVFSSDYNISLNLSTNTTNEIDNLYLKLLKERHQQLNYLIVSKPLPFSSYLAAKKQAFIIFSNSTNPTEVKSEILSTVNSLNARGFYINSTSYLLNGSYLLLVGVPSFTIQDPVEKQKLLGLIPVSDPLDGDNFTSDLPYADLNNDTYLDVAVGRLPENQTIASFMFFREQLPANHKALVASEYLYKNFLSNLLYLGGGMLSGRNVANLLEKQNLKVERLVEHRSNPIAFLQSLNPDKINDFIHQSKKVGDILSKLAGKSIGSFAYKTMLALKSLEYVEQGMQIYYEYDWNHIKPRWSDALAYLASLNTSNITYDDAVKLVLYLWPKPWKTLNKTNLKSSIAESEIVYYEGLGNGSVWILPNNLPENYDMFSWDFWQQFIQNNEYNGSSVFTQEDIPTSTVKIVWDNSDLASISPMRKTFLKTSSAAFIGTTAINYAPFSTEIDHRFFSYGFTVGESMIKAINDFRDDWFTWDPLDAGKPGIKAKTLREFMLWGDPAMPKDPEISNKDYKEENTCKDDKCLLFISYTPNYSVGNHTIDVKTDEYLLEPGLPIIPIKTFEFYLPTSAEVLNYSFSLTNKTYQGIILPKTELLSHSFGNLTFNNSFTGFYPGYVKILINKTIDNRTRVKIVLPLIFYDEINLTAIVPSSFNFSLNYKSPLEFQFNTTSVKLGEEEKIPVKIWSSLNDNATLYALIENETYRKEFSFNLSIEKGENTFTIRYKPETTGNYKVLLWLIKNDPITIGPRESVFSVENATTCVPKIKITEVMYNPTGSDSKREWIEIYNAGNCSVNLSEWRFWESNKDFDQSKNNHRLKLYRGSWVLEPGDYAIIASDAKTFADEHPSASCTLIDSSFSLANYGEEIEIKNSTLDVVDSFDYRPYAEKHLAYGSDKTLELRNSKWMESYTVGGTPCFANNDKPKKQLVITSHAIEFSTSNENYIKKSNETIQKTSEKPLNSTNTSLKKPKPPHNLRVKINNRTVAKTKGEKNETRINPPTGFATLPVRISVWAGAISSVLSVFYFLHRMVKH